MLLITIYNIKVRWIPNSPNFYSIKIYYYSFKVFSKIIRLFNTFCLLTPSYLNIPGDPAIGCNNATEFDCGGDGKMCILLDKVCDRKNDCGGWQDEPKDLCHINECISDGLMEASEKYQKKETKSSKRHLTVVGGGCDQQCIDLPIGFKCACDKGYKLVDNTTCVGMKKYIYYTK